MPRIAPHHPPEFTEPGLAPRRPVSVLHPEPPRPWKRWPWVLAGVFAIAGGLAALWQATRADRPPARPAVRVRTVRVRPGAVEKTLMLTGSTAAQDSVYLRVPFLRGRRGGERGHGDFRLELERLAPPGARVRKGDSVAVFDRLFMQERLDDYKVARVLRGNYVEVMLARLKQRRATQQQAIRAAKAKMDQAALELRRAPVLSEIQASVLRLTFEEAQLTYNVRVDDARYIDIGETAMIQRAQLDLQEADIEQRRAEQNLDKMEVRAPIDGLVVISETVRGSERVQIEAGDELRPGLPFARIVDTSSMIVEARVNQVDLRLLRVGAPARVTFDAYPGLVLPARVQAIGPLAQKRMRRPYHVSEVPVYMRLEQTDPRLLPSLTVAAEVVLDREEAAGVVPREAVFHDAEDGQPFAYVQAPSGWEKRDLELGLVTNVEAAVRSGLNVGDVVAAEPPALAGM